MEPKRIEDITRKEWIQYRWQELPSTFGDPNRIFIPAGRRTPDEALQAMESWDMTAEERDCEIEETIERESDDTISE